MICRLRLKKNTTEDKKALGVLPYKPQSLFKMSLGLLEMIMQNEKLWARLCVKSVYHID